MARYHRGIKLSNRLFKVRVPIMATYTDEEIEVFGMPVDHDNFEDKTSDVYAELVTVMLSLDKLIDIYSEGYPIHLVETDSLGVIYDILKEYINSGTGVAMVPNQIIGHDSRIEDITEFYKSIYNHNTVGISKHELSSYTPFTLGGLEMLSTDMDSVRETVDNTNREPSITKRVTRYDRRRNK